MTTKARLISPKSIIAILCTIALAFAIVPLTATSARAVDVVSGQSGSCTWTIDSNGQLSIVPTNGSDGTLADIEYHTDRSAPWLQHRTSISSVIVKPGVKANKHLSGMFADCAAVTSIDLRGLDTSATTDMGSMFLGCSRLTSLDISSLNSSNVTDMSWMFKGCSVIEKLDVSKLDTSKAITMWGMFDSCEKLGYLDVSGFRTSNVETMTGMFSNCPFLSSLNVSHFDTSRVTTMEGMFSGCASLGSLDVSNFDTSKVAIMINMFNGCSSLMKLDLSKFNTSNAVNISAMFYGCRSLRSLDLSGFDTSKVTKMNMSETLKMFGNCTALNEVKLGSGFSFRGATNTVLTMLPEGEWHSAVLDKYLTSSQIANERNNIADTFTKTVIEYPETPTPSEPRGERVTMYRLYNPNSGEHFYTSSEYERDQTIAAGWNDEGIGWIAPSEGGTVYRLYNSIGGEHHYTMSTVERDHLISLGWTWEEGGWKSGGYVPLMREYNPNAYANNHNYTTSTVEHNHLIDVGWNDEGIGWYAIEGR